MVATVELAPDYPLTFARDVVERGLLIEGHLLTAGEQVVLSKWADLPHEAGHAYARLISRDRQPVRRDGFNPPGITDVEQALDRLETQGFIDRTESVSMERRLDAMKVQELKDVCRTRGLPLSGRREDLRRRVTHLQDGEGPDVLLPRHRRLFRRLFRAGLQSHSGDLTKLILSEMGVQRPAVYPVRIGPGRWLNRREMVAYEAASVWRFEHVPDDVLLDNIDGMLDSPHLKTRPPPHRRRFSAWRQLAEGLASRLRTAEGIVNPAELVHRYSRLNQVVNDPSHDCAHRFAMVLDRAGIPDRALSVCKLGSVGGPAGLKFNRTGHRIAKRINQPDAIPALPRISHDRTLVIPYSRSGRRWRTTNQAETSVEGAVVEWLGMSGRDAFRSENALWTTLFALTYEPVLFADVSGAWPAPMLTKPADLGTDSFAARRQDLIEEQNAEMLKRGPGVLVTEGWTSRFGQRISGVYWHRWSVDDLAEIAEAIGPTALQAVLDPFLRGWRSAAKGLPDVVLPPGPAVEIDGEQLSEGLLFVEIKGPGDSIRDEQRWWLKTLRSCGIRSEVWRIQPTHG